MVNRTETAVIDLAGRGYVFNPRGNYLPGEYRHLRNCELVSDGSIRNRRPIRAIEDEPRTPDDANPQTYGSKIVGHYHDAVITAAGTKQYVAKPDTDIFGLWDPKFVMEVLFPKIGGAHPNGYIDQNGTTGLVESGVYPQVTGFNDWHRVVGFFTYNKKCYWIIETYTDFGSQAYYSDGPFVFYHIVWTDDNASDTDPFNIAHPALYPTDSVASVNSFWKGKFVAMTQLNNTIAGGIEFAKSPFYFPEFLGFFVHKDRLWLNWDGRTLFSKAGDPSDFSTPDGGFFLWPDERMRDAVAYRDTIYFVGESSVRSLTYNSDPNLDSVVRVLTDSVGGDSCTLVGDTVFFAKDDTLYTVKDQNITKFMALEVNSGNQNVDDDQYFSWKLVTFGNKYIVAILQAYGYNYFENPTYYDQFPHRKTSDWKRIPYQGYCTYLDDGIDLVDEPYDRRYSAFFVNVELQSIHTFDSRADGNLHDMYFCPVESQRGQQSLYIMYSTFGYVSDMYPLLGRFSTSWMHYMPYSQEEQADFTAFDRVSKVGEGDVETVIKWAIEIDSFSPDGTEYFVKRFRQLIFEGDLRDVKLWVAYDNGSFTTLHEIDNVMAVEPPMRPPFATKLGLNQRARSMSIHLRRADEPGVQSPLLLRSMAVTWNATGRAPVGKNATISDVS